MESRHEFVRSTPGARALPVLRESAAGELASTLGRKVRGEVRFGPGDRALYATAASNYRQIPIGVVIPRDEADVVAAVGVCHDFGAPIVSRGGGTSLAGQTSNAAVVIDFSKYLNGVLELDAERQFAIVEPGLVLDELRGRAERFHLTFGPDPATHNRCTLGGMIGNNSCGVHSVMAGCTADNVEELEILTHDGTRMTVGRLGDEELARRTAGSGRAADLHRKLREFRDRHAGAIRRGFPDMERRVSGYNLPALLPEHGFHVARSLVGSEGTLVTILRAKVRLVPSPPHRVLVVLGYPSVYEAADHVTEALGAGPVGLEGIDDVMVSDMKKKRLHPEGVEILPEGGGWLLVEFGGSSREEAHDKARSLVARIQRTNGAPSAKVFDDPYEAEIVWKVRESGLGATARVPGEGDTWEGWEDSSVPVERLGGYLRQLRSLLLRYEYRAALYGHFGQGCVHTRIPFELTSAQGVAKFRSFVEEAADLVVRHGGSLSGEHGDGQARAELLPRMFGPELMRAFEEFKALWDPGNKMNPGKIVHPYRLDENLRLGAEYRRPELETEFRFPEDRGSFAYATERCVGVGECRRLDSGTMCPSFMVTREEAHSTRGRARLLFEVMRGGVQEGFRSDAVREALDLCLSCKGCKSECPVNVDMATYKAEFLSHYYAGRLRPRSAYVFGLIHWWLRLGSLVPRLVNLLLRAPGMSRVVGWLAGIAPERAFPPLANVTFRRFWRSRVARNAGGQPVLLWVDTFNDHLQPSVLRAATEVLEDAGCRVIVTRKSLCCGRPLYDYGMLRLAKRLLREILDALKPYLRAGVPIVGLEPSCVAVFRDELRNLFPDDEDARALERQTFLLDEFLAAKGEGWKAPNLPRKALVHGHCHQKVIAGLGAQQELLERVGIAAQVLDSGCCGMAGGFGYERDHYAVSRACGERRLLPAVRGAPEDTLVIADGFSCREQIRQGTGRNALHLAEVLRMARDHGTDGAAPCVPEAGSSSLRSRAPRKQLALLGFFVAAALTMAWAGWRTSWLAKRL